ncbi:sensor domain-containing protein [Nocardia stercoris]|uniref:sensor domain-containing protein n=1 Tax=Nocardia stercoris TaxID=2483361 RepID=UPI00131A20EF|nr:sensor domain-containing protein [Nocardia stercoris]
MNSYRRCAATILAIVALCSAGCGRDTVGSPVPPPGDPTDAQLDIGTGLSPAELDQITGLTWNTSVQVTYAPDPDDAFADTGRGDPQFVPQRPCGFATGAGRDHDSWLYGTGAASYRKRLLVVGPSVKGADTAATQVAAVYPDQDAAAAVVDRIEAAVRGCAAATVTVPAADQFRWQCSDFAAPPRDRYGRANNGCVAEVRRVGSTVVEARAALPDRDEKYVAEMARRLVGKVGSAPPRAVAAKADAIVLTGSDVSDLTGHRIDPQMIFTAAPQDGAGADCSRGAALSQKATYGTGWQAFRAGGFFASPHSAFHQVVAVYGDEQSAQAAYDRLAAAVKQCAATGKSVTVATDAPARLEWHGPVYDPGSAPADSWELRRVGATVLQVKTELFGPELAPQAMQLLADRAE